ncbi:hypothetical protein TUM4249_06020 [Shewanella sp. KT0246]|nr:hypothetical protein TUM4249_06020 [Shewanella sp. KT0246]
MGTSISNIIEMFKHNECKSKAKKMSGYLITVTRSIKSLSNTDKLTILADISGTA